MARYALIKGGVVERVIVADASFFAKAPAAWLAQYDEHRELDADERACEPGSTIDGAKYARPVRIVEKTREELLEERIATLEAAVAAKAVVR